MFEFKDGNIYVSITKNDIRSKINSFLKECVEIVEDVLLQDEDIEYARSLMKQMIDFDFLNDKVIENIMKYITDYMNSNNDVFYSLDDIIDSSLKNWFSKRFPEISKYFSEFIELPFESIEISLKCFSKENRFHEDF